MRFNIPGLIFLIIVNLGVGYYVVNACKKRIHKASATKWAIALRSLTMTLLALFIIMPLFRLSDTAFKTLMWVMMVYFSLFVAQATFVIVDLLASIPRLFKCKRWKAGSVIAVGLGIAAFLAMWWGCLINRFSIDVEEVTVHIDNLPPSFEGYRIAQISDIHSGSYNGDTSFIVEVVESINRLQPDLIVFTGDIVNRHSAEMEPFVATLKRLHAVDGQLAIFGNHDYAEYYYPVGEDKQRKADVNHLCNLYEATALDLLLDEHRIIRRGNDSIVVIGVENISKPPYPSFGSLIRAYATPGDSATKILLSHDPTHWLDEIADNPNVNIALTLSGHTHAAQMKVGRLSPAAILHHRAWAGLYEANDGRSQLYVNIGIGTVGLPMRLGATPEITVITLTGK